MTRTCTSDCMPLQTTAAHVPAGRRVHAKPAPCGRSARKMAPNNKDADGCMCAQRQHDACGISCPRTQAPDTASPTPSHPGRERDALRRRRPSTPRCLDTVIWRDEALQSPLGCWARPWDALDLSCAAALLSLAAVLGWIPGLALSLSLLSGAWHNFVALALATSPCAAVRSPPLHRTRARHDDSSNSLSTSGGGGRSYKAPSRQRTP